MLHFLIGTAGTGKTHRLFSQIEATVGSGERAILLVPEQTSFESEKRLHRLLGPRLSLQVEVLSVTRLCNSIFRSLGGLARAAVTPAAKYLMMSTAVSELQSFLSFYRKSVSNPAFLQTLLQTCSEFKTAGVSPEKLARNRGRCSGALAEKLTDLSTIYSAYQALLEQSFSDPDDDLIKACALLELHPYFCGKAVFVDGFATFMSAEFEFLHHVIAQAQDAWFAMTCDAAVDRRQGMGVFSPVQSAMERLSRTARENGVAVDVTCLEGPPRRYQSAALAYLSQNFLMQEPAVYDGALDGDVSLYAAPDRYGEVAYVAGAIIRLAREQGYRFREIAVVARDTGPYLRALETVFARHGIPYFCDLPVSAENHPLITGLLYALDCVRGNFDVEAVLLLAKSPLLHFPSETVAQMENYCYCWGVRGAVWEQDFVANPRGLTGALTPEDADILAEINRLRAELISPLADLRAALSSGIGSDVAAGIYGYLVRVQAADHLCAYANGLDQEKKSAFLNESVQIWDAVMDILDVFGSAFGEIKMKRARLCELLRMALLTVEIGLLPQTLDQVLVGKADRIRPGEMRAVFLIGAVEGEFPAQVTPTGVFSDAERRQMIDAGIAVSAPTLERSVLERFFAYYAATLPAERLFVSFPRAGFTGQELLPSLIVSELLARFPSLAPDSPGAADGISGEATAFDLLARVYGQGTQLEATLKAYFQAGDRRAALARMEKARKNPAHCLLDKTLAREFFGSRMRLSPTRVERYFRCPFSYFAADGLGIRQRQKVAFTPLESGSVIHNVLHVMVQRHGGRNLAELPDEQMQTEIDGIIRAYIEERTQHMEKLPERFRYLFFRLSAMLARLLRRIGREFAQSAFSPAAFELPISEREGVEPLRLVTIDGVQATVEGVVDRVDIMDQNGKRYVRVVDYKSGAKSFELADVLYGLNMQMLIYLFTIQENAQEELAGRIPAGVLYMPVRDRFISAGRDTPDGKIEAEREKQWRMNGLLLEDEEALRGMDQDLAGVFIPVKMGKNGLDAKSALAGKAEIGRLGRKVKELVLQMVSSLSTGDIRALPIHSPDHDACAYCDYRTVCGHEPDHPVRQIAKMDREAVFKMLREEEDD